MTIWLINREIPTYDGALTGSAIINAANTNCALSIDSCKILSQPQTCNGSLGSPVVNITFGSGANNPGPQLSSVVSGATTNYNYADYATGTPPNVIFDGDYSLVNQVPYNNAWYTGATDHTGDPNGYMAFFNSAPSPGEFYKQTVTDLCPGTTYEFAAWVGNAINPAVLPTAILPNITFKILDGITQAELATYNTGDIPNSNSFTWQQYSFLFTLPAGHNSVTLILANNNIGGNAQPGNDLALDDITFKPCGPLTTASFSNITILESTSTNNCSSINLYGKITGSFNSPSYQWQVSKDGGTTYNDIAGANTLSISYSNLLNEKYLFRLLSAEAGNINSPNCRFISNKITLTVVPNIDSVHISSNATSCNIFDLKGIAYGDNAVIDTWDWSFDEGVLVQMGQNVIHAFNSPGIHPVTLVVTDLNGCKDTAILNITANGLPANPTYIITQPTCTNTVGALTISHPLGSKFQYSIDGTTYQSSPNFINLSASSYNITVKDITTNCISVQVPVTISTATPPASASNSVTHPNCSNVLGAIKITAPLGSGLQYSIDGNNYQTSTSFVNLNPASYNITVKNINTGCISSPATVVVNPALSVPATPSANLTQPVCNDGNGTIVVLSPLGSNIEYSLNNINFQTSISFGNIIPETYNLIAKDVNSGCLSTPATVLISKGTGTPVAPTATVSTQPDCINTTGTISVTLPIGNNYQFSIDGGSYQAATAFTNANPGNHNLVVKNSSNGCVSLATSVKVNAIPLPPAAPSTTVLQPTCAIITGTINITSSLGNNMEYSLNNNAFQGNTYYPGLIPGTYNLVAKNNVTKCVSAVAVVVVNVVPSPPLSPSIGSITQPSCSVQTGTINIETPMGANLEFNINGSNYQSSNSFSELIPGTYSFTVRNNLTSCVSGSTTAIVNPLPPLPPTPVAIVTVQPTCIISGGKISVSSPSGSNYEYSINGVNYQSSNIFTSLLPNTYNVTVKDLSIACISLPVQLTVTANINTAGTYLIPNAFTPNHDGFNECFGIKYWGVVSDFQLIIYNW